MAMPEQEVTIPSTSFPCVGITSAGSTASKAEATRFTPDMNRITSRMNGAGIWTVGTLDLTGGTITGNVTGTGQNGGGVFCSAGTLNLEGAPVVSGNNVGNL